VQKKQKKVTQNTPAKKWFRVQRAPSQDCGFVVWKWKPLDELTEEEKDRFFPKTENEIVATSVQSTPAMHESLQVQTSESHSELPAISTEANTQHVTSHDLTTTTMPTNLQTRTDLETNEPPMKRARIETDAAPLQSSLPTHFEGLHPPQASNGEALCASQAIFMDADQVPLGDNGTRNNESALDTSMDLDTGIEPSSFSTETPVEAAAPMEVEIGTVGESGIASSTGNQTAPVEETNPTAPTMQTSDEAQASVEMELINETANDCSDLVPEAQAGLASADLPTSSNPSNTVSSDLNELAVPPQAELTDATKYETQTTEATHADVAKQQNAESEAAAALSSLADIFASEPNAPESS
jgi:hypothetical protein